MSSSEESDEYFQYERQFGTNGLPTEDTPSPYESSVSSIDSEDLNAPLTLPSTSTREEPSSVISSQTSDVSEVAKPMTPPMPRRRYIKKHRGRFKKGVIPHTRKPKESSAPPQSKRLKIDKPRSAMFEDIKFPKATLPYKVKIKTGDKTIEKDLLLPHGNQIFNLDILANVFALFKCTQPQCPGRPKLYQTTLKDGLQRYFILKCQICHTAIATFPATLPIGASPDNVVNNKSFVVNGKSEINRRSMLAVHTTSMSWCDFILMCCLMDLPKPKETMSTTVLDELVDATKQTVCKSMQLSAEAVRYSPTATPSSIPGVVRCSVSFDATWHQRGHYSNQGFAAVIDSNSGKVIDYVLYDRVCYKCIKWPRERREREPEKYNLFWKEHAEHCLANYSGTSQSMETSAAIEIWGRSVEKNQLMYATYIGDGDSSSFKNLLKSDPYKGECIVRKEECLGHVQKRLKNCLKVNRPGCKGLSDVKADHIAGLYRLVVIQNRGKTAADIHKSLEVLTQHSTGQHTSCPPGTTSWCYHQKNIAQHSKDEPNVPLKPRKPYLSEEEGIRLREALTVFGRLSFCECLTMGTTQNANESLHSVLWHNAPKTKKVGQKSMQASAALAVLSFNDGSLSYSTVLDELGIPLCHSSLQHLSDRDKIRYKKRMLRVSAPHKKRRRELAALAVSLNSSRKRKNKDASYNSGMFGVELESREEELETI